MKIALFPLFISYNNDGELKYVLQTAIFYGNTFVVLIVIQSIEDLWNYNILHHKESSHMPQSVYFIQWGLMRKKMAQIGLRNKDTWRISLPLVSFSRFFHVFIFAVCIIFFVWYIFVLYIFIFVFWNHISIILFWSWFFFL